MPALSGATRLAGRVLALAWLGAALWRFVVAVAQDQSGGGEAQRQHLGLLMLQALCALISAGATLGLGESFGSGDRRGRTACGVLLAVGAIGFVLIFTKSDLLAWGVYEN